MQIHLQSSSCAKMIPARKKIAKEKGAEPDDFEASVAQVLGTVSIERSAICVSSVSRD